MGDELPRLVDTPEGLDALARDLADAPRIGVDTEFHAEGRYRPELMLVQLARPGGLAAVVDARAVDLRPLGPLLARAEWVAHGAAHDVALLHRATGARPRRLLDVQVAAALAGWPYPVALDRLAADLLGARLDKPRALSDWSRRPLSPEQVRYAAEDARVVLVLADALAARLGPRRLAWARAAGEELVRDALRPPDPDERWLSMRIAPSLDAPTRRVLHALYAWREERARRKGVPPHYALADAHALDIARRRPTTLEELRENRRLPGGLVQKHGGAIVEVVRRALASADPPPEPGSAADRDRAEALRAWALAAGGALGIAPDLLLPPRLALEVARRGADAFEGWRAEAAGRLLGRFLAGRDALRLGRRGPEIVALSEE